MKTPLRLFLAMALAVSFHAVSSRGDSPSTSESGKAAPPPLSQAVIDRIGEMTSLFDGQTLDGWIPAMRTPTANPPTSWTVKGGVMASTGAGRGVIYTAKDYGHYRLIFKLRHVSGKPDHQPCVLIFCTRPAEGEKGLDALGGIQFQAPNGGHWDYRPGHNNGGTGFINPQKPKYDNHEWSQAEILVNAAEGTARMAVAQPVGTRAVENLDFKDPAAGKVGPIAAQMHNAGLFDEFKDIRIEVDPKEDRLITTE